MRYISAKELLALHDLLIESSGGSHGVRDVGLLESAAMRARTTVGGKDVFQTVFEKAAAYLDALAQHHVFVDGNKRTAFEAAAAFLHFNGHDMTANDDEVVVFIVSVATDKPDTKDIAMWLKQNSKKQSK